MAGPPTPVPFAHWRRLLRLRRCRPEMLESSSFTKKTDSGMFVPNTSIYYKREYPSAYVCLIALLCDGFVAQTLKRKWSWAQAAALSEDGTLLAAGGWSTEAMAPFVWNERIPPTLTTFCRRSLFGMQSPKRSLIPRPAGRGTGCAVTVSVCWWLGKALQESSSKPGADKGRN